MIQRGNCPVPAARCSYATDLTDEVWAQVEPLIPHARPGGRPYEHTRRALVHAYCYVVRTGSGWRMLPKEFPPWQTVHWHVTQWQRAGLLPRIWQLLDERRLEKQIEDAR
jgi:transposase